MASTVGFWDIRDASLLVLCMGLSVYGKNDVIVLAIEQWSVNVPAWFVWFHLHVCQRYKGISSPPAFSSDPLHKS